MGIENRFFLGTGSQWVDSLESFNNLANDSLNDSSGRERRHYASCVSYATCVRDAAAATLHCFDSTQATWRRRAAITLQSLVKKDDNNAYKVSISSKGGNTSNMQKHLRTQHVITSRFGSAPEWREWISTLQQRLLFILKVKLDTAYHVSASFIIKPAITNC